MLYQAYASIWRLIDLIFPPSCAGCGKPGVLWCAECQEKVTRIKLPYCEKCGEPIEKSGLCKRCQARLPRYEQLISYAQFEGSIRNAIHRLKYRRDIALGLLFSEFLYGLLERMEWEIDKIVPVPLGNIRLSERGYNQSSLIAKPLAMKCQLEFDGRALFRVRDTVSQVGLSYKERRANVKDAFVAKQDHVVNKNVLLIDDVATSGATIEACTDALLEAGANKVYGLTVARATFKAVENISNGG